MMRGIYLLWFGLWVLKLMETGLAVETRWLSQARQFAFKHCMKCSWHICVHIYEFSCWWDKLPLEALVVWVYDRSLSGGLEVIKLFSPLVLVFHGNEDDFIAGSTTRSSVEGLISCLSLWLAVQLSSPLPTFQQWCKAGKACAMTHRHRAGAKFMIVRESLALER